MKYPPRLYRLRRERDEFRERFPWPLAFIVTLLLVALGTSLAKGAIFAL